VNGTDRVHKVEWIVYIYGAESIMKRVDLIFEFA